MGPNPVGVTTRPGSVRLPGFFLVRSVTDTLARLAVNRAHRSCSAEGFPMRQLALLCCAALFACKGSGSSLPTDAASANVQAAAQLAQSGVECEPEAPPAAVAACTGKDAGATCTVNKGDDTFTGTCVKTPSGVVACAPAPHPEPPEPEVQACNGLAPPAACSFPDAGTTITATCNSFASVQAA